MIYKTIIETSETDLQNVINKSISIRPIYKSLDYDIESDISWIHAHSDMIVGAACEFIWDLYYDDFLDNKILSKLKFYELVRHELNLECKHIRLSSNIVKYCFIKSQHDSQNED